MSFIQLRVTSQTFLVGTENIGQSILNLDIRLDKDLPQWKPTMNLQIISKAKNEQAES